MENGKDVDEFSSSFEKNSRFDVGWCKLNKVKIMVSNLIKPTKILDGIHGCQH